MSQLPLRDERPVNPDGIWFRYDPPVLLISLDLHGSNTKFVDLLYTRLLLAYVGGVEMVCKALP
jgi:hypothetical protein